MTQSISKCIGERIRTRRKLLNLSQAEVAKSLGVGQSSVAQYESGQRDINAVDLARLSEVFNVPISYFYAETSPYSSAVPATNFSGLSGLSSIDFPGAIWRPVGDTGSVMMRMVDEEQLLDYYRRLSDGMKKTAIAMIASMCDNQPPPEPAQTGKN